MNIQSCGRKKDGALYVKAQSHHLNQTPTGTIHVNYHGNPNLGFGSAARVRACCDEFETQAKFELSGLQLLNEMMSDLEE